MYLDKSEMTIAMKNSGEGGTPVGNESSQETSAIGNTVRDYKLLNIN